MDHFPRLRRIKQQLNEEEIDEVLSSSLRGVLSLNSPLGFPYIAPLNHYYEKESKRLYFHGAKFGYRLDCLKADNRASYVAILDKGNDEKIWAKNFHSVIAYGRIHILEDEAKKKEIILSLCHKFTTDEEYIDNEIAFSFDNTLFFYLEIEHVEGKRVNES